MSAPTFVPRPAQERILAYRGGYMGVSAVPGSGKTFTLSLLAARLVEELAASGNLGEREILVVTMTNSAAENFRSRIGRFLREERGLLPGVGYRVRTLHGLAHDIVRERPSLVGLSEDFDIVDERAATDIIRDAVLAYLRTHPDALTPYILPEQLSRFRSIEKSVTATAIDIAGSVIRLAKEQRREPYQLKADLARQSGTWPLLELGLQAYADYQRGLLLRGAVDFNDLIGLALRALDSDPGFLSRLQDRWPYILEDEAQDSSLLQENLLRRLAARHGNWVRVGDPNQAINTTFTGADVRFLRRFVAENRELARDLPNSGRSALPIIEIANSLITWSQGPQSYLDATDRLAEPLIEPTPPGDPQPNPPAGMPPVHLYEVALAPHEEIDTIVKSVKRWLPAHPDETVAILTPDNQHGFSFIAALERANIPFDDSLLSSTLTVRAAANVLAIVLSYIAQPQNTPQLARLWSDVWWPRLGQARAQRATQAEPTPPEDADLPTPSSALHKQELPPPIAHIAQTLRALHEPEQFIFPAGYDWLEHFTWLDEPEQQGLRPLLLDFRRDLQRWTRAATLPVDELLLTIGANLFSDAADLALTHHLAVTLARLADERATGQTPWRLPELAQELDAIAQNKRRALNFAEGDGGYTAVPGKVTVATMHKAKGLEWDRVYLTSVNSYSFPTGGHPARVDEQYRSEPYWARDHINLVAEAIAQFEWVQRGSLDDYVLGDATYAARRALAAERLRLLYVGITRARKELILTYNTGRNFERNPNPPAAAFEALRRRLPAHTPDRADR